jgi:hypothetical protein
MKRTTVFAAIKQTNKKTSMNTIETHKNQNGIEYYSTIDKEGKRIFSFSPSFEDIWNQEDQDAEDGAAITAARDVIQKARGEA